MTHPAIVAAADQIGAAINALPPAAGQRVAALVLGALDDDAPEQRPVWLAVAALLDGVTPARLEHFVAVTETVDPVAVLRVLQHINNQLKEK